MGVLFPCQRLVHRRSCGRALASGARGELLGGGALLGKVFSCCTFLVLNVMLGTAAVILTSKGGRGWEQSPSAERAEPGGLQGSRQHQTSPRTTFLSPASQGFLCLRRQNPTPYDNDALECSDQAVRRCQCALHAGVSLRKAGGPQASGTAHLL